MITEEQLIALRSWVKREIDAGIAGHVSNKDVFEKKYLLADEAFDQFRQTFEPKIDSLAFRGMPETVYANSVLDCHVCGRDKNHCICLHRPIRRKKQHDES